MKHQEFDHAALVEDWLKEPIGLPEIDTERTAQLVHLTPQQHGWLRPLISRRSHTMFSAMKFAAAGVIVVVFGGFLVSTGLLTPQSSEVAPGAVTAAPSASPSDPAPEALLTVDVSPLPEVTLRDDALVMGAGKGGDVAGWSEVGRTPTTADDGTKHGEMRHPKSVADRLVAIGSISGPNEGPIGDVLYHSIDGVTWVPTTVPGNEPKIADLASTSDGLMAAGSDVVDGTREARIWSSTDGIAWAEAAAPDLKRIDQIVSAEGPVAVRGGKDLWTSADGTEWTFANKIVNSSILRGPGGFLTWQLGDFVTIVRSTDLVSGLTEVGLPNRVSKGGDALVRDTQIFATDDLWVLVPHVLNYPDAILTSPDGLEWTEIPRPPGMIAGTVRWMANIGDEVQAFGPVDGAGDGGIWTFVPGEPVGEAEIMADNDAFINAPVAFGDGYAATGLKMGRNQRLTSWERIGEPGS
jgi:hypothetical protein